MMKVLPAFRAASLKDGRKLPHGLTACLTRRQTHTHLVRATRQARRLKRVHRATLVGIARTTQIVA
jgi:hypothetical protein